MLEFQSRVTAPEPFLDAVQKGAEDRHPHQGQQRGHGQAEDHRHSHGSPPLAGLIADIQCDLSKIKTDPRGHGQQALKWW